MVLLVPEKCVYVMLFFFFLTFYKREGQCNFSPSGNPCFFRMQLDKLICISENFTSLVDLAKVSAGL